MKFEFDENKVKTKIERRVGNAQFLLTQQVIKDSNLYCPQDTGDLQESALRGSTETEAIWDVEYARRQYYEDNNKSKDLNPRASYKWFEVAKVNFKKQWEKLANDKYNS